MKKLLFSILGVLLALPAAADTLRFDILEARWDNPVDGTVQNIDNTFGDPVSVQWGNGGTLGIDDSGYDFNARTTPFEEAPDDVFALGGFTHFNQPIPLGTSISQIDLFLRGNISVIDSATDTLLADLGSKTFDFTFFHDETLNSASPCAYADDGTDPQGDVNRNGCADQVDVSSVFGTDTFTVDDVEYTLNILGFSTSISDAENGIFTDTFLSAEGANNNRILAASFSTELPAPIPLPAAAWMLLAGMGALGAMSKFGSMIA